MNPPQNRLAGETSPYLLQHADNPVDWYPWCEEALELARKTDRPILLSIGYSACHWCHVMAHESFENPATADVMNRLFVNIKVDREERPDLDKVYQMAHQMLVQRPGGWPLTMFLDPGDLTPFFGGTYFPDRPRHGMPSFTDLLQRVANYFRENRDEVGRQAEAVQQVFKRIGEVDAADSPPSWMAVPSGSTAISASWKAPIGSQSRVAMRSAIRSPLARSQIQPSTSESTERYTNVPPCSSSRRTVRM